MKVSKFQHFFFVDVQKLSDNLLNILQTEFWSKRLQNIQHVQGRQADVGIDFVMKKKKVDFFQKVCRRGAVCNFKTLKVSEERQKWKHKERRSSTGGKMGFKDTFFTCRFPWRITDLISASEPHLCSRTDSNQPRRTTSSSTDASPSCPAERERRR